jgi:hypothetical protein
LAAISLQASYPFWFSHSTERSAPPDHHQLNRVCARAHPLQWLGFILPVRPSVLLQDMTCGLFVRVAWLRRRQKFSHFSHELIRSLAMNRVTGIVKLYQAAAPMCRPCFAGSHH